MKHSVYLIAGAVALLALSEINCEGQGYKSIPTVSAEPISWIVAPQKQTSSYLRYRVTTIYSHVLKELGKVSECGCDIPEELNRYKSESLLKLENRCEKLSENGCCPYWYRDSADWIFTQDMDNPRLVGVKVNCINGLEAKASVVIDVFGDSDILQNVDLWLVFENGDWYIDDFQDDAMKFNGGDTLRGDILSFIKSHIIS